METTLNIGNVPTMIVKEVEKDLLLAAKERGKDKIDGAVLEVYTKNSTKALAERIKDAINRLTDYSQTEDYQVGLENFGQKTGAVMLPEYDHTGDGSHGIKMSHGTYKADANTLAAVLEYTRNIEHEVDHLVRLYANYDAYYEQMRELDKRLWAFSGEISFVRPYIVVKMPAKSGLGMETTRVCPTELIYKRLQSRIKTLESEVEPKKCQKIETAAESGSRAYHNYPH